MNAQYATQAGNKASLARKFGHICGTAAATPAIAVVLPNCARKQDSPALRGTSAGLQLQRSWAPSEGERGNPASDPGGTMELGRGFRGSTSPLPDQHLIRSPENLSSLRLRRHYLLMIAFAYGVSNLRHNCPMGQITKCVKSAVTSAYVACAARIPLQDGRTDRQMKGPGGLLAPRRA